jgi:predicted transcriptional regulator
VEFVMSYSKRGFLEIMSEILNSLSTEELIKTHISFKCKLDSRAVAKYLGILLNNDLIRKSGDPVVFMITKKGNEFLIQYNKLMNLIDVFDTPNLEESMFNIKTRGNPTIMQIKTESG